MTRRLTLGFAALLLGPLALGACKGHQAQADAASSEDPAARTPESSLALPVVGEPVRRGDLVLSVATTGVVRSEAVAQIKAETNGTIQEVRVRPGSPVRQGDTILQLDPRPFDLAVREAGAALEEAEIHFRGNLVSDSIVLGPQGSEERYRNALALSGVPGARIRLDKAKLDRERATITAPFDGVVDQVTVAAGERVSPGQDVARLVDVRHLRVEAQVLEHDLPYIRVGGEAWITAAAAAAPVRGRIAAILPLVDTAARAGRVVVAVDPGSRGGSPPRSGPAARPSDARGPGGPVPLMPGMYADVKLEAARLPDRILVPSRAVIERDGRPLVFAVRQNRAQWVYLVPGRSNGVETEVLPDSATGRIPLAPGDTVLVEGHLTLTHDAPVRLVTAAEQSGNGQRGTVTGER
ncbi:MAG TPA: efflux RND transporter periplasmic adaptor subunit [Gemmatimonadales bacterium]|nr:efflux RND transporter periplasmic adaptor subunit [Gemmatimonadales bacterium]